MTSNFDLYVCVWGYPKWVLLTVFILLTFIKGIHMFLRYFSFCDKIMSTLKRNAIIIHVISCFDMCKNKTDWSINFQIYKSVWFFSDYVTVYFRFIYDAIIIGFNLCKEFIEMSINFTDFASGKNHTWKNVKMHLSTIVKRRGRQRHEIYHHNRSIINTLF